MQTMRMTRRQLLQWLGAGSGAIVLAACTPVPGGSRRHPLGRRPEPSGTTAAATDSYERRHLCKS